MSKLQLSLSVGNYDRVQAILNGRVAIDGVELVPTAIEPEEAFHRAFRYQEFDISEISLSSHTMMTSRGQAEYVGIPAFVSRVFRQSGIYIRTDRGIKSPIDLQGRRSACPSTRSPPTCGSAAS